MFDSLSESLPSASLAAAAAALNPGSSVNFRLLLPFAVFPFLLIALLIVLPGIREQRTLSLLAISVQLCVGALLIGAIILPFWKVGSADVLIHLQAQSRQRHVVRLGVGVGLRAINISLDYIRPRDPVGGTVVVPSKNPVGLHLNEQFQLDGVSSMREELEKAFSDGLPFPVLRVLEYFSLGQEAFAWGRRYRNAGHFSNALLWGAFASWLVQSLLLAVLPHHFAKAGLICGVFALIANVLFISLSPADLHIPFASPDGDGPVFLQFHFGICFWMSVCAALLALLFSSALALLQLLRLYSLSTFLGSSLDDTVGPPKCRFGGGRRDGECGVGWAVLESSSTSSRSMPPSSSTSVSTGPALSKCSVASSVTSSAFSLSATSLCSAPIVTRLPRSSNGGGEKSVDMIRKRIVLARYQQQQQQQQQQEQGTEQSAAAPKDSLALSLGEVDIEEEEEGDKKTGPRRKEGVAGRSVAAAGQRSDDE